METELQHFSWGHEVVLSSSLIGKSICPLQLKKDNVKVQWECSTISWKFFAPCRKELNPSYPCILENTSTCTARLDVFYWMPLSTPTREPVCARAHTYIRIYSKAVTLIKWFLIFHFPPLLPSPKSWIRNRHLTHGHEIYLDFTLVNLTKRNTLSLLRGKFPFKEQFKPVPWQIKSCHKSKLW